MARSATTFVKGEKSRKQGRPKGSPNKLTREFRETVQKLLDHARLFVAHLMSECEAG